MPTSQRILIVGCSGSGKSTLAEQLSRQTGIPATDLDTLFWGPNWTPLPLETFQHNVANASQAESWIIAGNYFSKTHSLLWPRATHIVWLDYGLPLCFYRALRRTLSRLLLRTPLWSGNRESFRQSFLSRDSVLRWVIAMHPQMRQRYAAEQAGGRYPHLQWIRLATPSAARQWLARQR